MRKIPNRLWDALCTVMKMEHPSIAGLLRANGCDHEADRMDELSEAMKDAKEKEEKRNAGKRTHRPR
jgi:hypothetical protein